MAGTQKCMESVKERTDKVMMAGFHLGYSSRGGGANATIAELKGGEDYSNTSCFSSIKNIIIV